MKSLIKQIIFTACLGVLISDTYAQSDIDALRFSQTPFIGSSARSLGLGGAIGAVGADQSVVLTNPAGLAQFKGNSFNISLGTVSTKNQSTFGEGPNRTSNLFNAEFPSVNVVWTDRRMRKGNPVKTGWINTNFQIGYNKVADFDRSVSYKRDNANSSYTDGVVNLVRGMDAGSLEANDEQLDQGFYYFENMFWHTFLIDSLSNRLYYANYDPEALGGISQSGSIVKKGHMGEFNMSFAGNYNHKIFFGAAINVNNVNYSEVNKFSEIDNVMTTGNWDSYDFTRNLETSGFGFNGRLGVIFRPNNNIRIGGTIHTPTKLVLTDEYSDELYVIQDDGYVDDWSTIDKEYSYTITTPAKYGLQGAYIFGKKGLLSAEVESIDYSTMNLTDKDGTFDDVNEELANKYQSTVNLKFGGEYVLDAFRLRAGFASIGNPLADASEYSRNIISGGFGIQEKNWAFDFGVSKDLSDDVYVPYQAPGVQVPGVSSSVNSTRLMLTLTNKF